MPLGKVSFRMFRYNHVLPNSPSHGAATNRTAQHTDTTNSAPVHNNQPIAQQDNNLSMKEIQQSDLSITETEQSNLSIEPAKPATEQRDNTSLKRHTVLPDDTGRKCNFVKLTKKKNQSALSASEWVKAPEFVPGQKWATVYTAQGLCDCFVKISL